MKESILNEIIEAVLVSLLGDTHDFVLGALLFEEDRHFYGHDYLLLYFIHKIGQTFLIYHFNW
jgi:hypothetical protein